MAKQTIANGDTGAVIRAAINDMFTEIYAKLVAASATADGYLTKEDFSTFAAKQDALTSPVTLATEAPATASSAGTKGQIFVDGTDIYVCIATNTWIKGALTLATWGE